MTFKQFFKYYAGYSIIWSVLSAIIGGFTYLGIKVLAKSYDEEHEAEKTQNLN